LPRALARGEIFKKKVGLQPNMSTIEFGLSADIGRLKPFFVSNLFHGLKPVAIEIKDIEYNLNSF